jgi:hypothetical protein
MSPLRSELPQVEIACTLTGAEATTRSKEFAALGRTALTSRHKTTDGIVLVFEDNTGVHDEVKRLADAEASCCSFLGFDLKTEGHSVTLTITGPQDARPVLDSLFEAVSAQPC